MGITVTVDRVLTSENGTIGVVKTSIPALTLFSLEDYDRPGGIKVPGDTAIPRGQYPIRWRKTGRWAERFKKMGFMGSLEICDVPNFTDVLIHIGNTKGDTEGCLLLGMGANLSNMTISQSKIACQKFYHHLAVNGGNWTLVIR